MNLDNLTIPEYWVQLGIGDVYKITMIKQNTNPVKYRLRLCNPETEHQENSYYELIEPRIRDLFKEYNPVKPEYGWKELEFEYENVFKNSYGLTVCNLKPKLSDLKLETMEIHNGLVELWYSSEQEEGLFYYYFNYEPKYEPCELLTDSYDGILVFMAVPTIEVYDSVLYEKLN